MTFCASKSSLCNDKITFLDFLGCTDAPEVNSVLFRYFGHVNLICDMLCVVDILLVIVFTWERINTAVTSRTNFTRQPFLGYRCQLNDTSYQMTLLNTSRDRCVWRCLSNDSCIVLSYNHMFNYCELSVQLCDSVMQDTHFSINVYGIDRKRCLHWVPESGYDPQKAVVFPVAAHLTYNIAVARKRVNSGLYPGKQNRGSTLDIIIVMYEDIIVSDKRGEILLVDSACLWEWIPYTSPNILPVGAVEGGYDPKQEPLYVARARFENFYSTGYYKASNMLGYFMIWGEVRTAYTMDILVIL